jgi:hypothetical protein
VGNNATRWQQQKSFENALEVLDVVGQLRHVRDVVVAGTAAAGALQRDLDPI